jgi:glycerophosphoryl diester phosphodiesterase
MKRRTRQGLLVGANLAGLGLLAVLGGWDVVQLYTGIGLPERTAPPMQLVAHRGDLDRWPENTLESITAAAELPVDGIEFDTIQSADGTWWVIHDATLDRTTDGSGYLPALSDEEIARVRIADGIGFTDGHADLRVPRLADVLAALRDYDGMVYVDVQHAPAGDVADVVSLLDGRHAAILCRNLDDTRRVKQLAPEIETYLRTEDGPADETVDGWLMESFFEADVGAVHGSDLPVITFVEQWRAGQDEAQLIRRAWAIGVHAFLTKSPDRALEVLAEMASSGGESDG